MRRWIVLAGLFCLACAACATGEGPPDTAGDGGATTAPPGGPDEGAEGCGATLGVADSACEEPEIEERNTCLDVCSEAAERGCDWVASMCDVAESVSVGAAKIPCVVATLVACGGAILCDHLCPR